VAFVKRGRIVEERRLAAPTEALDVELRVARIDAATLQGLSRYGSDITQPGPGVIAMRTSSEDAIPAIVTWLVQQGLQVYAVQPRRASLEDVFLDVMGDDERPG
jgi:hypothetical protein